MVPPGETVLDVGTDHGHVLIELVRRKIIPSGTGSDVREGPIRAARNNISKAGLSERIDTILSDGLRDVPSGVAHTLIMTGMGSAIMKDILSVDMQKTFSFDEYVFSPQRDIGGFRTFLAAHDLKITDEEIIKEKVKYYVIIKARKGHMELNEFESRYGPLLLKKKPPCLMDFLRSERMRLDGLCREVTGERIHFIRESLRMNKEICARLGM